MNYRTVELLARTSFTSDITRVVDIDISDPISNLVMRFETTNSSATMTAHPLAGLVDITVVDGSEVLFSLDGYEAEALDWYHNGGKFRSNYNYYLNGGTASRFVGLNFGRWLWDRLYALDPKRFNNLQLKVTIDIDAGGMSCATTYLSIWANCFDERTPELRGFLTAKELKQYTMASTVHEYTDLPTDHPYRALYFRAFLLGTEPNGSLSNFKLTEDQGKRVPIDLAAHALNSTLMEKYGPVEEHVYFATSTGVKYIYCAPTTRVEAHLTTWAAASSGHIHAAYNGDGGRLDVITNTTGDNCQVHIRGFVPHCVYEIPFGMKDDPDDAYNVSRVGNLKADITGGAAAQGFIFVQQYRHY